MSDAVLNEKSLIVLQDIFPRDKTSLVGLNTIFVANFLRYVSAKN